MPTVAKPSLILSISDADACAATDRPPPWPAGIANLITLLEILCLDAEARAAGFRDHGDRLRWLELADRLAGCAA